MPGLIGPRTSIADAHKRIALFTLGPPQPDGEGGFTRPELPLDPPTVNGYVRPASQADLERLTSGSVIATATHVVSIHYHPGVTIDSTLHVEEYPQPERIFSVVGLSNPDERDTQWDLICVEVID